MILTGFAITEAVEKREINISPFDLSNVNPNSYNYRLGQVIKKCMGSNDQNEPVFDEHRITDKGYLLKSRTLYLGHTVETIGSNRYATSLIGRSSIGRLGLFVQISANVGHTGTSHQWTLELYPTQSIIVYPRMVIGQVSFWKNSGEVTPYRGFFGNFNSPTTAKES